MGTTYIPQTFSSVSEVQQLLTSVLNLSHRQLAAVNEGKTPLDHCAALQKVQQWCEAFDRWLPLNIQSTSDEDITNLLPVLLWRIFIGNMLRADYTLGEVVWDSLLPELMLVVDCAERYLDLTAELVAGNEVWKHSLTYTKESSRERAQQTLNVQQGGQITEGLLAKLLAGQTSMPAIEHDDETSKGPEDDSADPVAALLERACLIAKRKDVVGRSTLAADGQAQICSTFTVSHGIVYPLFAVICRCRNPPTRKRALRILEVCNRHEGLWGSKLAAQSAKRRMMVEETEALNLLRDETVAKREAADTNAIGIKHASQIPNHCRVRATGRTFLSDDRVLERFCMGWKGSLQDALTSEEKQRWIELSVMS